MSGSPNPRATALQSQLEEQSKSDDGTPAQLGGFIARGGAVKPVPGDLAPYGVALATASADGRTGVAPAAEDGDKVIILADRFGRLWSAGTAPDFFSSTVSNTGEISRSVVPPAGEFLTFVEVVAYNGTGAKAYLLLFDSATLPANGTVPTIAAIAADVDETVSAEADPGVIFPLGITAVFSTTPFALTAIAGSASYTIFYRLA